MRQFNQSELWGNGIMEKWIIIGDGLVAMLVHCVPIHVRAYMSQKWEALVAQLEMYIQERKANKNFFPNIRVQDELAQRYIHWAAAAASVTQGEAFNTDSIICVQTSNNSTQLEIKADGSNKEETKVTDYCLPLSSPNKIRLPRYFRTCINHKVGSI